MIKLFFYYPYKIKSAAFSATAIVGAFVFPEITTGIIEASTTLKPDKPQTFKDSGDTTAMSSFCCCQCLHWQLDFIPFVVNVSTDNWTSFISGDTENNTSSLKYAELMLRRYWHFSCCCHCLHSCCCQYLHWQFDFIYQWRHWQQHKNGFGSIVFEFWEFK